ncbi:hypothetical protein GCM10010329_49230 [Streptomyces spiroverticillatus]|uniref:non-specific serine/threonine protein kinase n=1 Tax=Streptomyces finlayi TaxID=67296 RepID=A0A918X1J2_9ACTN|nr:serine/threonine-protein kinase [Streptomyces finlayi]GHA20160.1 hypothetical protein GCM10010329_49230 [Streptomyces spiroverticillatus]GHD02976.1 hypothetical protein GCM10010334_50180 [Streptomyces finlayi]
MADVDEVLIGGRYRLQELIGQGGMGRVWRGTDETLGRPVAVKEVLLPQGITAEQRDVLLRRVMREARAAARLNHPGIITVHDVVEHAGAPVIVMEYVTGQSLAAAVARSGGPGGGLPVRRVAEIGLAMLAALERAHAAGIVHRDLKPDNVLLMDDRVILTDFGIAHMADATTALTHTGTLIGTPAYMAPEQLVGRPPEASTDLWALGATLYCAVEGQPPFSAETFTALCIAVATEEPRPPQRAGALAPVLAMLLTKDPALRADAGRARAGLEAVVGGVGTGGAGTGGAVPVVPTQVDPRATPTPVRARAGTGAGARTGTGPDALTVSAAGRRQGPQGPQGGVPARPARAPGAGMAPGMSKWLRFLGCLALVWAIAFLLPWNRMRGLTLIGLLVMFAVAALNAFPRPRLRPVAVWGCAVVANLALFVALGLLVRVGFGRGPLHSLVNALLMGTGAWLMWWKLRVREDRPTPQLGH